MLGFSAARRLPKWRRDQFLDREAAAAAPASPRGDVYLLADTFNRYFEPENLRAALKVLAAAGYRAMMPKTGGRPLCCGRTWLAVGMVDKAREEADATMQHLSRNLPIIGLEPSCLMTLRDEFRSLLPGAATDRFAERSCCSANSSPGKARSSTARAARNRTRAWPLSSEGFRRISGRLGDVATDPKAIGATDRIVMLRHGRHVRLPGGNRSDLAGNGRSRPAASGARRRRT